MNYSRAGRPPRTISGMSSPRVSGMEMRIHKRDQEFTLRAPGCLRWGCVISLLLIAGLDLAGQAAPSPPSPEKLISAGHFEEALQQLDDTKEQGAPGVAYLRGMAFYLKGEMTNAAAAFATAVGADPQNQDALEMEGVSLFRAGRPAEAADLLERAHQPVRTANVDPKYVLGLCYLDMARYDDARKVFADQYGFQASSAEAYLLEARMLLRRGYLSIADAAAYKALELNRSLPKAHLLLGEIALAQSQITDALLQFQKEQELDPLDGAAYERMGDAYIRGDDVDHAQQALDRAILLEPKVSIPYILLGKVLLKRQNPFMAKMYLEHALQLDPSNYIAHFFLGQAYRALGQNEDATKEFQLVTKIQAAAAPKLESAEQ
jgi:tetratricopeptide (TPR) repeat protein